jgi:hypothetical protein
LIIKRIKKIIFTFFIFLAVLAAWGFLVEPNLIKTERVSIEIKNIPGSLKDLKIVQISDLHLKKFDKKSQRILDKIRDLEPDFIFVTGDIVDWTTKDLGVIEEFFGILSAGGENKIFAVFGNHDHKNNKFKSLGRILEENGVTILSNESEKIEASGDYFYLIGVDDPHLGYDDIKKATIDTEESFVKILLAHSPEIFRKVVDKKIDLVLTGHTHGCQVAIPFFCNLVMPLDYDKKYKSGLFKEGSTYLYVNRGIGMTLIPFRLNAPPEITLFNFK